MENIIEQMDKSAKQIVEGCLYGIANQEVVEEDQQDNSLDEVVQNDIS